MTKNALIRRYIHAALFVPLVTGQVFFGCADASREDVVSTVAQSVVVPASVNPVVHQDANHEFSVTFVSSAQFGGPGDLAGRWVVAANPQNNNCAAGNCTFSWAYSQDASGNGPWTWQDMSNVYQNGAPPTLSPTDSTAFNGWLGDPAIAADANPATNNYGKNVITTSVASTAGGNRDPIVAWSGDGGATWGHLQYLDVTSGTGNIGGGAAVDMTFVASNPVFPYDTYATWAEVSAPAKGFLRKIAYDNVGTWLSPPPPIQIPKMPTDQYVNRFNFGFGKMPPACSSGGEGLYIVYTNDTGLCDKTSQTYAASQKRIYFNLVVYDTATGQFWGPWTIADVPNHQRCAGWPLSPDGVTSGSQASNNPDPHIAVDPNGYTFNMSYTRTTSRGIRAAVSFGTLGCPAGAPGPAPLPGGGGWVAPDPDGLPPTNPDGGVQLNDDFLPAIANHLYNGVLRTAVYWYGTRDDINNHNVAMYMSYSEALGAFTAPQRITVPINGAVTWPLTPSADVSDYQTLGTSWQQHSFLAVWATDTRTANSGNTGNVMADLFRTF